MWTYILRRCLLMVPTLFGVTIISFCIMQLAPGDPLLGQTGAAAGAGMSTQTREAYLVQKRDLKLDRPLILNFRYFQDYRERVTQAAYLRSRTLDEILAELPALASPGSDPGLKARVAFLRTLKIKDFDLRLQDPEQRASLAKPIQSLVQIACEDMGKHGVPAAMEILHSSDADLRLKIGAIRALNSMVIDPFVYTYSHRPSDAETPQVLAAWQTWWDRNRDRLPPISPERLQVLQQKLQSMAHEPSREKVFEQLERLDRDDMRFFADTLLGGSALPEKVIAAAALRLYVGNPLKLDVPIDAGEKAVGEAIVNWDAHFELRRSEYFPGVPAKLYLLFTDTQYAHMVWRLITFNFGRSALRTREPVSEKIWDAVKVSAPLMLLAQLVIYFVAVPLGITCSVNRGKGLDQGISLMLFLLYSIPAFVAGMLMLLFLCYGDYVKWFPTTGLHSDVADTLAFGPWLLDYLWHITLPVICLSLFSLAGLAMYARSSMLDIIQQDYIRTARAKGLPEWKVILKHALRNSLIPIITLFSNFLPAMLGGSVLVEVLFSVPGMGKLSFGSIDQKDFPTLMALIYIDAIVVMFSILLSDILYVLVDPRISFSGRGDA